MSYIENNLVHGEHVIYKAEVSWLIYFMPLLYVVFALVVFGLGRYRMQMHNAVPEILAAAVALIALFKFLRAFLYKHFTEIAVTNKRIIAKFGVISRESIELPLVKIESVIVEQSILGRIINAGSIEARGTGTGFAPVRFIDNPILFRNNLNEAIANAKQPSNLQ